MRETNWGGSGGVWLVLGWCFHVWLNFGEFCRFGVFCGFGVLEVFWCLGFCTQYGRRDCTVRPVGRWPLFLVLSVLEAGAQNASCCSTGYAEGLFVVVAFWGGETRLVWWLAWWLAWWLGPVDGIYIKKKAVMVAPYFEE